MHDQIAGDGGDRTLSHLLVADICFLRQSQLSDSFLFHGLINQYTFSLLHISEMRSCQSHVPDSGQPRTSDSL